MRKLIVPLLALTLALLCGCTRGKLADSFDENKVKDAAKAAVTIINTQDYDAVITLLREDLQDQVTAEQLHDAWDDSLVSNGAFVKYKSVTVVGTKDETTKEDYALAVLVCKYENGSQTFTLTFDSDYLLVGLHMR